VIGREVAALRGHEGGVKSAAFSPDGTRVVTASWDKSARVWHTVPYRERFPAIDAARKAEARVRATVQSRIAAGERVEAVRASAIADASISEVERRAYLIVTTELQSQALDQASAMNSSLRPRVVAPVAEAAQLDDIVAQAEQLLAMCGDDPNLLNTVGVAMFRAARYEQAIEVLRRSDALFAKDGEGEQPADWAFIAMAHWQLNRTQEAREAAAKFRTLAAMERWSKDEEVKGWVKEVDALIAPE